jgi:hypothetical protein
LFAKLGELGLMCASIPGGLWRCRPDAFGGATQFATSTRRRRKATATASVSQLAAAQAFVREERD